MALLIYLGIGMVNIIAVVYGTSKVLSVSRLDRPAPKRKPKVQHEKSEIVRWVADYILPDYYD